VNAGDVAALVTAVTALVTALGTFLGVVGHLLHHDRPAAPAQTPPAAGDSVAPR
jgi:hypothetical protein